MTEPGKVQARIETAIAAIILAVALWLFFSNRGLEGIERESVVPGPSQRR